MRTVEEAKALQLAAAATGVANTYQIRWAIAACETSEYEDIEAVDLRHAIELAEEYRPANTGDDTLQITEIPDHDNYLYEDEFEIDRRAPGNPFSWDACHIVKDLAMSGPGDDLTEFLVRAREACTVPSIDEQIAAHEKWLSANSDS